MIKIKRSSAKWQIMAISSAGSCEFMSYPTAFKMVMTLAKRREPFVILNKRDNVVFASSLKLSHLKY